MNGSVVMVLLAAVIAGTCSASPEATPSSQPAGKIAEGQTSARLKLLHANVATFKLDLWNVGPQDKPFYTLLLHVPAVQFKRRSLFQLDTQLDEAQASKLIDQLAADHFLDNALEQMQGVNHQTAVTGPAYCLVVTENSPDGHIELFENLGWGPTMLARLDGLRSVLAEPSVKEMDTLLSRLSGLRKQREQAAGPATKPTR